MDFPLPGECPDTFDRDDRQTITHESMAMPPSRGSHRRSWFSKETAVHPDGVNGGS